MAAFSPAMSSKVTFTDVALSNLRLWFLSIPANGLPDPSIVFARRDIHSQNPMMSAHGSSDEHELHREGLLLAVHVDLHAFLPKQRQQRRIVGGGGRVHRLHGSAGHRLGTLQAWRRAPSPLMTTDWTFPSVSSA